MKSKFLITISLIMCLTNVSQASTTINIKPLKLKQSVTTDYDKLIKEKVDTLVLAKVIYHEARNQKFAGKVSVCQVVLNRVKSNLFENDIVKVVYSKNQFSWIDKQINVKHITDPIEKKAWEEAKNIASNIIKYKFATSLVSDSLYFHSGKTPKFFKKLRYVKTIGGHKFYK